MKRFMVALLLWLSLAIGHVVIPPVVPAAELLDVKPVTGDGLISIEITADIPMTYSYYKIPGQARAVVDIADADPEKVEPLIVVNKGAVSSISVDKAQISGMVVSRIIFNLVSEMEPVVKPSADRKKLTVLFGNAAAPAVVAPAPAVTPPAATPPAVTPPAAVEPDKPQSSVAPAPGAAKEEDPLGLDEPTSNKVAASPPVAAQPAPPRSTETPATSPVLPESPQKKIEPVVPIVAPNQKPVVHRIVAGTGFIDIEANGPISQYKMLKLTAPERLAIDIPNGKSSMAAKMVVVNKLGIAKVRVGSYPTHLRLVLDASGTTLPPYRISPTDFGLRVSFE